MAPIVSYILMAMALFLAIPVILFLIEVIVALSLTGRPCAAYANENTRRRVAVLVPAHNESIGILSTLDDIKAQLQVGDRLLVIADNCDDDTAAVATAAGAEIVERNEPSKHGKGYALDFGIRHLSLDPPAIVIVIDADCRIDKGAIDQLATTCGVTNRPLQALYLMTAPDESQINSRVAEFAWRIKNWVRPLGLSGLNLPCQLMGTGMAFPWEIIQSVNLASSSIVEDIKLGLDLAQLGSPPIFCPSARATSQFPLSVEGTKNQRKRWEVGHISMILTAGPNYIYRAIADKNLALFILALDMTIPPLSLLLILLVGMSFVAGVAALFGLSLVAFVISATCMVALVLAIYLSWLKFGRQILPPSAIISVFSYILAKTPIYRRLLSRSDALHWIRTDRRKKE
jgi:cellulose synthase/poly-beta-1,6-N-acetylglucosamine synthase-like glycosyltransferase